MYGNRVVVTGLGAITPIGCSVDEAGFETLMEEQRARGSFAGSGEAAVGDVYKQLASELGDSEFLGYEKVASEATLKTAKLSDSGTLFLLGIAYLRTKQPEKAKAVFAEMFETAASPAIEITIHKITP